MEVSWDGGTPVILHFRFSDFPSPTIFMGFLHGILLLFSSAFVFPFTGTIYGNPMKPLYRYSPLFTTMNRCRCRSSAPPFLPEVKKTSMFNILGSWDFVGHFSNFFRPFRQRWQCGLVDHITIHHYHYKWITIVVLCYPPFFSGKDGNVDWYFDCVCQVLAMIDRLFESMLLFKSGKSHQSVAGRMAEFPECRSGTFSRENHLSMVDIHMNSLIIFFYKCPLLI